MADTSPTSSPDAPAASSASRRRALAGSLLDIGAVDLRPADPFTWSSGLVAPIYCDNRLTLSHPRVRRAIRDGFVDVLREIEQTEVLLAGTATAGIPHAAWLAEALDQPMVYVRSSAKGHGKHARIEGVLEAGAKVVVVEDLISTGGSALGAVQALRDAGAVVEGVLAIFSYELDAAEAAFEEAGVDRHVLTTFPTLIDVAHERGDLSDAELAALKDWRNDPAGWSVRHGGSRPD